MDQRRFRDVTKLHEAVRERCLREFEVFAGKPWNDDFRMWATPPADENVVESEAKEIRERLKSVMRDAVEFAGRTSAEGVPIGRTVASFLRWWAPQYLGPLLEHVYLQDEPDAGASYSPAAGPPRFGRPFDWHIVNSRSWLVSVWDAHWGAYGIAQRERLSARQYAVVSLLAGNWPREFESLKVAVTAAKVIEAETKAMRIQITRRGVEATAPRGKSKERKQSG